MAFSWKEWLPLIIGGAGAAGDIIGGIGQNKATNKAIDLNAQATKDALATMAGFFALEYGNKAPYRAAGGLALPEILKMSGLNVAGLPKTPDQGAPISPSLASIFQGANIPVPKFGGAPGSTATGGSLAGALGAEPQFGDISTKGIREGGLTGALKGALGGGIGAGGAYGIASKLSPIGRYVGGPITAGIGAGIGAITGAFDNNNTDKDFASTGINRVSDWTWNQLMPAVKSGQISPEDAEAAFNDVWGKWESSMKSVPNFNQGIYDKSVASQRQFFNPFFTEINRLKQGSSPAGGA